MAIPPRKNIWVAAGDGDLDRVKELVEQHNQSPNVPDDFTYTPMHAAASYGHRHILEYLIAHGGDVNLTDDEGDTPLYTVEDVETAQFLIQHGAILERRNNEGISPIEHLREDYPQVAAYLETLLPPSTSADTPSAPVPDAFPAASLLPSQHSQNAASENLTNDLMARIQTLAQQGGTDMGEEQLRQIVTASVLESFARGHEMQQEAENREAEETSEKRTRVE
ncbi:ankyrin [Macrolepiota fuliginosa MF-IS2]|uniref:Ankyrin n=1 Tax=Macrolepiota fuliginosa MF-IS2 TaxID=1400762 RepID=A0A9P5XHA4_9AGAR|nr:ankyrin [Macrolepiota fuliginosa MF-IS2]